MSRTYEYCLGMEMDWGWRLDGTDGPYGMERAYGQCEIA